MTKRKAAIWALLLISIAAVTALLWKWIGTPMITFLSDPVRVRAWVEEKGFASRLLFALMQIFQIVIAVVPGEPFEIAAGYAFGAVEGTIICTMAAAAGSILVFGLVRIFGKRLVHLFFPEEKLQALTFLQTDPKRELLFLIIYIIPGTPKDLLSYFAGLTDIPFTVWLVICSLGRIPSILSSTIGGDALGAENYGFAIAVFVVTTAISALGIWAYNRICRKKAQ